MELFSQKSIFEIPLHLKQNCRGSDETYGPGQQKVGLPYKIHSVGFDKEVNPVMYKMAEKKH